MKVGMECDEGDHVNMHAANAPNQSVITSDPPEDPSKRKYQKSQGSIHALFGRGVMYN